jgi:23S rRNA pseudouridine1911/1915/1917 synthase
MSAPLELIVGDGEGGVRLDRLLAERVGSRARAAGLIADGAVLVDGRAVAKSHIATAGERIAIVLPADVPAPLPPGPLPFQIAYEDDHLLVVDKPAGLVVHPGRGHREGTLAQVLAPRLAGGEDPARVGVVHRLDRDTSGLLVLARSEDAHRRLRAALSARHIQRHYTALVEGRPPARSGTIDAPIGRDRRHRTRMSLETDTPRVAVTDFQIERMLPATTLLAVQLRTGRTHQIRVHLTAIGHPVVGDPEYGTAGMLGLGRQFLHASRLAFEHPIDGHPIDLRSPLPADLQAALERAQAG